MTSVFGAIITFVGPDQGGRHIPPQSGFHPQIDAGGVHTSCIVEGLSGESVFQFDVETKVLLRLMFPDEYSKHFSIGSEVRLYEGSKLIGKGKIFVD
jgi:hypothetical protein